MNRKPYADWLGSPSTVKVTSGWSSKVIASLCGWCGSPTVAGWEGGVIPPPRKAADWARSGLACSGGADKVGAHGQHDRCRGARVRNRRVYNVARVVQETPGGADRRWPSEFSGAVRFLDRSLHLALARVRPRAALVGVYNASPDACYPLGGTLGVRIGCLNVENVRHRRQRGHLRVWSDPIQALGGVGLARAFADDA